MTIFRWQAYVADVLEAEGVRYDHTGEQGELVDQLGAEVRCALGRAAPPVTVFAVAVKQEGEKRS